MKTVSTAFKEAQKSPAAVSVRRVSYKRRYWVEASKAYTWEAAWTVLPENEIVSVSPITGKLDTDKLNEFKISNVNLVLKNERRQWKAGKRGGYFGVTDTYPDGFEPYWTKFKIESGYEVAGVATYVPLFVGVATGFSTAAASDTIQVDVRGLEALLENANAENVSTLVTLESMGTGNGSNKDFTTVHPGVGIIKEVSLNGIAKKPGTDYSVSQLNEPTLGAKISFTTAPGAGVVVRSTYRYWKQNQKIEDVIGDLLTEAGISGGSREISRVIFSSGITLAYNVDSQSDWLAGTNTDGDVTRSPGDYLINLTATNNIKLLDDFSDGQFTSNPVWTTGGYAPAGWSVSSNRLMWTAVGLGLIDTPSSSVVGEWDFDFEFVGGSVMLQTQENCLDFTFMATNDYFVNYIPTNYTHRGYRVRVEFNMDTNTSIVRLFLNSETESASASAGVFSGQHTLKIIRSTNGVINVYIDGNLKISSVTSSPLTSTKIGIACYTYNSGYPYALPYDRKFYVDNIKCPKSTLSAEWASQTFDLSASVQAFGQMVNTYSANSGTATISTRTSPDGSNWDAWLALGGTNNISSAVRRYIQIKAALTLPSNSTSEPLVSSMKLIYSSTSTTISMPNFTDKTVYQAIQQLGSFANYEWGFNEQEIFFFRQKPADTNVDETLDASTNLLDISNMSDGTDRVYSEVQATYGNFDITVGDDGLTRGGPIARYGKRRLTIDGGDILLAPDTDIATGVALGFYSALNKPKRTLKAKTKLMEWLDLSDTVSLTFNDNIPARPWFFGDTSAALGDKTLYLFGDADQTAKNMLCKVTGYRHDTENKTSEFDLEEILS